MRLDFDTSRTIMLLAGLGGFAGEFVASLVGLPTNAAIIGGSVTLIITATGASAAVGTARERRSPEAPEARPSDD